MIVMANNWDNLSLILTDCQHLRRPVSFPIQYSICVLRQMRAVIQRCLSASVTGKSRITRLDWPYSDLTFALLFNSGWRDHLLHLPWSPHPHRNQQDRHAKGLGSLDQEDSWIETVRCSGAGWA